MLRRIVSASLMTASLACANGSDPVALRNREVHSGFLVITPSRTSYDWNETTTNGTGIVATVKSSSTTTFYAKLGDAFNSALDQPDIFAAEGSSGFIERTGDGINWSQAERAFLVEGVRYIAIRPNQIYTLRAFSSGTKVTGTYRLRIDYQDALDVAGPTRMYRDNSPTFTLR